MITTATLTNSICARIAIWITVSIVKTIDTEFNVFVAELAWTSRALVLALASHTNIWVIAEKIINAVSIGQTINTAVILLIALLAWTSILGISTGVSLQITYFLAITERSIIRTIGICLAWYI